MMRLIDADELDKLIVESFHMTEQEYVRAGYSIVRILMDKCPTVNAEPVRHGHWIGRPVAGFCTVRCSICNEPYLSNDGRWHYCPNCGARMDEEAEE